MLGLALLGAVTLFALTADIVAPYPPERIVGAPYAPPDPVFLLGTDEAGRDILSRVLHGARVSLLVGLGAQSLSAALGVALGLLAGYFGGRIDSLIMRAVDVFMAFPFIVLAILIVAAIGPSLQNVIVAIGLTGWTGMCRIVRAQTLGLREEAYVEAARAVGASDARIISLHIFPNSWAPVSVVATLGIAAAILEEASLSFLGLGIQPPTPSWGTMIARARVNFLNVPHLGIAPGVAIFVTVLAFNLIGDGLRDALDPRMPESRSTAKRLRTEGA